MKLSNLLLALSLSLSLAACGGSSTPAPAEPAPAPAESAEPAAPAPVETATADVPAEPDYASMSNDELGESAIGMMQAMADTAAEHKGDCDAQAAGLQAIVDSNQGLMTAMKNADADPAKKEYFETNFGPRAMEVMGGMMPNLAECSEHEGMMKVFQSFE